MLFISHSTADKSAALDLFERARKQGYEDRQLFLDSHPDAGIAAGSEWQHELYERLKQHRALLVICSPRLNESKWCFAEFVTARTLGKLVFPIVFEEAPFDAVLSGQQAVWPCREGDAAFERLWRALDENGLGPQDSRPWPPLDEQGKPTDPCPYPGLVAFSERFAPVYFGRDRETIDVLESLNTMRGRGEPRLLMVVGGSGSGKSSLLRAGVLPRLERNRNWQVLSTLRYGRTPNEDLTLPALLAQELAARFPPGATARPDWKELRTRFESDDVESAARDFFEATQDLNLACGSPEATTLLPIDQFEELLAPAARPSAEQFLRFLRVLLSKNNGRLLVIGTLRSDYLDVYERHQHALQPPFLESYRLPPFPWERVTDVIVQPAARVDVTFANELLERLKCDAPTSDALPLLAFTLEKLFRSSAGDGRIELREYEALGGMTGAIEQAVRKIVPAQLPPDIEQALRLSFVRHLVQVNEKDEFVRRPARWSDLPAAAKPLLQRFVDERLLHTSGEADTATVEVSHEALFRCWPALVDWLKVSSHVLRWRRDVERSRLSAGERWDGLSRAQLAVAADWPRHRPEELTATEIHLIESARRKVRNVRLAVAATVAVILAVAAVAVYQGAIAESRRKLAAANFELAGRQREVALTMIRDTLYTVQDELEQSPNTAGARKRIAAIIGGGMDRLDDERLSSDTLLHLKAISNISNGILALEQTPVDDDRSRPFAVAHERFDEAARQLTELARKDATNADYLRDLSWVCNKHGDLYLRQGDGDQALRLFQQGLDCIDRAAALTSGRLASDQMWSRLKLGDYFVDRAGQIAPSQAGDDPARAARLQAADWYEQSEQIAARVEQQEFEERVRSNLDNALAATLDRLCDVYHELDLIQKETDTAERVVALRSRILAKSPSSRYARQYLAHALDKRGTARMHMGQPREALNDFLLSLGERRQLSTAEPQNVEFASYLADTLECVADARDELGESDEALSALDEFTRIYRNLRDSWPDDLDVHYRVIDGATKTGNFLMKLDRVREAAEQFQIGLDAAVKYDMDHAPPQFTDDISKLRDRISECRERMNQQQ